MFSFGSKPLPPSQSLRGRNGGYAVVLVVLLSGVLFITITARMHRDITMMQAVESYEDFRSAVMERRAVANAVMESAAQVMEIDADNSLEGEDDDHAGMRYSVKGRLNRLMTDISAESDTISWEIEMKDETGYTAPSILPFPKTIVADEDWWDADYYANANVRDLGLLYDKSAHKIAQVSVDIIRKTETSNINLETLGTVNLATLKVPLVEWSLIYYSTPFLDSGFHGTYPQTGHMHIEHVLQMDNWADGFWSSKKGNTGGVLFLKRNDPDTDASCHSNLGWEKNYLPGFYRTEVSLAWRAYEYYMSGDGKGNYPAWSEAVFKDEDFRIRGGSDAPHYITVDNDLVEDAVDRGGTVEQSGIFVNLDKPGDQEVTVGVSLDGVSRDRVCVDIADDIDTTKRVVRVVIMGDVSPDAEESGPVLLAIRQSGESPHIIDFKTDNYRPVVTALFARSSEEDSTRSYRAKVRFTGGPSQQWNGALFVGQGYEDISGAVTIGGHVSLWSSYDSNYFATPDWKLTITGPDVSASNIGEWTKALRRVSPVAYVVVPTNEESL
jgi:hypothetical protein